ncbi:SUMO E1-like activator enzyme Rad31 [Schizosaccharomyces japonicus yFS275]|uniref:SUMO E1-like activator enzyme Rad31 n=1 Tax=Schizosaccharomyces japonicus (strain yFS275 / FY16936) TaxID=402676 RepID=B6K8F3_SCHJY|nr:SUMO E1-like activator enzyme Rad31 [Schizosaccharomyces japonicus yFS275]EEB09807.1 SUMO E1-like activator enzyme Rad31 [Schizosaccharomyces japonicus yFS275]
MEADEVALYDRQIRLWGFSAQEAIKRARVLLLTVSPLANEIAKNIVLAGVGELCFQDENLVTDEDVATQFLLDKSDIGCGRAHAAAKKIASYNPLVKVTVNEKSASTLSQDELAEYSVIIATQLPLQTVLTVNDMSHKAAVPFYFVSVFGMYGFAFTDLRKHTFIIERTQENKKVQEEKSVRQKPLSEAILCVIGDKISKRKAARISPCLPALLAKLKSPCAGTEAIVNEAIRLHLEPDKLFPNTFFERFMRNCEFEWAPIASVVGGIISQDALNVLGNREYPMDNIWIYDGETGSGPIYKFD